MPFGSFFGGVVGSPPPVSGAVEVPDDQTPPVVPTWATTPTAALASWLNSSESFASMFPGGLHYGAAPSGVEYPFVVFSMDSTAPTRLAGLSRWSEFVSYTFDVWDSGDEGDGSEIAEAGESLATILFGPRGEYQEPIEFSGGRIMRRRGAVESIGLAPGMGRSGADMFKAEIKATVLVARDS